MPANFQSEIALERLERAVLLLLFQNLNTQIAAQNTSYAGAGDLDDPAFWAALGRTNPTIQAEPIANANFYPGHVPSLIDAPIDRYPNVAVMAFRADVVPSDDDWAESYLTQVAVEIMCKFVSTADSPDQTADALAAEAVNSRIKRTAAAVHSCIKSDDARHLFKTVPRIGETPNIITTDVFVRKEEKGRGPRWFWQGARMDYRVRQWVNY